MSTVEVMAEVQNAGQETGTYLGGAFADLAIKFSTALHHEHTQVWQITLQEDG